MAEYEKWPAYLEDNPGHGIMRAFGDGVPADGIQGYGKGCQYRKLTTTGGVTEIYINRGTIASATWFTAVSI